MSKRTGVVWGPSRHKGTLNSEQAAARSKLQRSLTRCHFSMPSPSESHDAVRNLKQRATDLLEQIAALPLLAADIESKRA